MISDSAPEPAPADDDPLEALPGHIEHGQPPAHADSWRRKATLTLAALGVVYGDIGTSPIYAVREIALAAGHHVAAQLRHLWARCR